MTTFKKIREFDSDCYLFSKCSKFLAFRDKKFLKIYDIEKQKLESKLLNYYTRVFCYTPDSK